MTSTLAAVASVAPASTIRLAPRRCMTVLVVGTELRLDLLRIVGLVALDLLLSGAAISCCSPPALGLERLDAGLKRGVGLFALQSVDRGLDRLAFRLERRAERLRASSSAVTWPASAAEAVLHAVQSSLTRSRSTTATSAPGICLGALPRQARGPKPRRRRVSEVSSELGSYVEAEEFGVVALLLEKSLGDISRSGPKGEIQLTPMPIDRRGLAELPRKTP